MTHNLFDIPFVKYNTCMLWYIFIIQYFCICLYQLVNTGQNRGKNMGLWTYGVLVFFIHRYYWLNRENITYSPSLILVWKSHCTCSLFSCHSTPVLSSSFFIFQFPKHKRVATSFEDYSEVFSAINDNGI